MPPGGPGGGPHGGGGGPHGGGRGYGVGRGPLSGGPGGGRSYGSMMRPPGGYWGENSGPLSPDRGHSSGFNPNIDTSSEPEKDQLLITKLGSQIYKAQVDAHRAAMLKRGIVIERGTPIPGKDIRLGSRIKGFFVGIGRVMKEPFSSLRSDYSQEVASFEYGDKAISKREYGRRMYNIEERKLYKSLKRGYITEEEYNAQCDRLEQELLGGPTQGGPTR